MFKNAKRLQTGKHTFRWAIFTCLAVFFVVACGSGGSSSNPTPTPTAANPGPTATSPTTPSPTAAPFQVTSIDMSVTPASIAGMACGTNLTVTYTATFHVAPNSAGGVVQFSYTVNNGRGQSNATLTFAPGETMKAYTFTWSGALPVDHTYPEPGGIQVTSPNAITSALVGPTGSCK